MCFYCNVNKKYGAKKNNYKKPYYYYNNCYCNNSNVNLQPCCYQNPVGYKKHCKSCGCIQGKDYFVVNDIYYDNYYKKYNHYYVTDCNHITDHICEYNVYHYNTKSTYDKKCTCKDVNKTDNCVNSNNNCNEDNCCDSLSSCNNDNCCNENCCNENCCNFINSCNNENCCNLVNNCDEDNCFAQIDNCNNDNCCNSNHNC